jgi:hypothetical protein
MLEAARTSETVVNFYQTTRRYNPEDSHHLIAASFDDPARVRATKYIFQNSLVFHKICCDRLYEIWNTIV